MKKFKIIKAKVLEVERFLSGPVETREGHALLLDCKANEIKPGDVIVRK